ncbi:helix-turn-helix domain-containing protein [Dictyobacter arantiisoli]|uniref:HTH cro/C1-type domain-containing protein n=1 Tax=Dictyobacter arantiisoli TaxID=2014874 RepID=A0A5A5TFW3_9CHLR|nr:helix-turn-helix domain-containing protein [Dictyobacter arantiisoli]GCF10138.1 hypothetical protein KDI_37020 [Dictyobacter arantiisoli]
MKTQDAIPWNEFIRQERIRRNWRQRDVAERLGTTPVTVTRWESGSHLPSAYFRMKLCTLFEKSEQELGFSQNDTIIFPVTEDPSVVRNESIEAPREHALPLDAIPVTSLPENLPAPADSFVGLSSPPELPEVQKSITPPQLLQRRTIAFLLGAGTLGLAATATFTFWFPSSSRSRVRPPSQPTPRYPLHPPQSQRLHHLVDMNTSNWINHVAWSSDNRYLATASGSNTLTIWEIEKDTIALAHPTLNQWINDVSWSKTNWVAAVTAESGAGALQLWKFPESTPARTMKKGYALRSVSWSPDNSYLAISGHSPTVEVWNSTLDHLVSSYTNAKLGLLGISRVTWSPSGRFLACATDDGTAHVWEALTGQMRVIYHGHQSRVHDLAWSPNERAIVSCSTDQTSQVWDAATGHTLMTYRGQKGEIEGVDWSPHGTWIASASADHTVQIWAPFTGQFIALYDKYDVTVETAHWSTDGTMLAIGTDKDGVEIWPGQY